MADDARTGVAVAVAMATLVIGLQLKRNREESENDNDIDIDIGNGSKSTNGRVNNSNANPEHRDEKKEEDTSASALLSSSSSPNAISTLTNKRGSSGMNLPPSLSKETIAVITATAPAVAPRALDITRGFYSKVIARHPHLLAFFNPSHNVPISLHQPRALAASIVAYATHINDLTPLLVPGGAVEAICHRHCALGIFPAAYGVVHDTLMESIKEVLGDVVTPEIANAWSEAVLYLAGAFIDTEEALYTTAEKREGGWSGAIPFLVSDIKQVADNIKSFSFRPPPSSPLHGKSFQFTPGQYLSITVDVDNDGLTAPRHYTVTSPPGADFLQITVKQIDGGKVSTFLHRTLRTGDAVKLAAPFGVFTLPPPAADPPPLPTAVLVSAGIGITPMLNFRRALGSRTRLCVHVDSTPAAHAYRDLFRSMSENDGGGTVVMERYSRVPGEEKRVSVDGLVGDIWDAVGGEHRFYICGPERWMMEVQSGLMERGAKEVSCEVFGSQLATGCPFFAHS